MIDVRPKPELCKKYYAAGQWRDETIGDLVARSVAAAPRKLALKNADGSGITYAELDELSSRLAQYLRANGFGEGDVLTMHLPNWWQSGVVMLATYKLGGVVHAAPPTYGWKDLAYTMAKCKSKAIVAAGRFRSADYTRNLLNVGDLQGLPPICLLLGEGAETIGVQFDLALAEEPIAAPVRVSPDSPAAVVFSSGTESKPKGVIHTHNTMLFGERMFGERLGLTPDDVCFMATPLSHMTGFVHGLVLNLTRACTLSLQDIFEGKRAVEIMQQDGATWTMGSTPFLNDTINALAELAIPLPRFRFFACGGAPLPEAIVRLASKVDVRVLPVYGSTESPPHTLTRPEAPLADSWETDGEALPGIEMRVVDADGRDVAFGVPGEELSRGPNTFIGYLDEPELTARAIDADNWYHSGDIATMRADNTIKIVGRIKDIIIRGGQNISAREVEDLLIEHEAIKDVAIVGRPHARLGETAVAVVTTKGDRPLQLDELTRFLVARGVGSYKLPEALVIWPELPRTPSGKIQKYLIRQKLVESNAVDPDKSN